MKKFEAGKTYKITNDNNTPKGLITVLDRKGNKIITEKGEHIAYPNTQNEIFYIDDLSVRSTRFK